MNQFLFSCYSKYVIPTFFSPYVFDGGGDDADWRLGLGAVTGGDFSRDSLELWWWIGVAWVSTFTQLFSHQKYFDHIEYFEYLI